MKNSLREILLTGCLAYPNKVAIFSKKRSVTYSELSEKIHKVANFLKNIGLKKSDRALFIFDNTTDNIILFWACVQMGVVPSLLGSAQSKEVLFKVIDDLKPKVVFGNDKDLISMIDDSTIFIDSSELSNEQTKRKSYYHIKAILEIEPGHIECEKIYSFDLALIIYTSGSTGSPKGVMLTHRNVLSALHSINSYLNYTDADVILCILPFSFDYGLYQMFLSILVSATLVIEENFIWMPSVFKSISRYRVTIFPLVSTVVPSLHKIFKENYVTDSVKKITNTGVHLSIKHIEYLENIFPKADIFSMYGLTECKRCSYVPPSQLRRKPKSIGIPMPNLEMFVISEEGKKCAPGESGQIVVRSESIMQGYWNNLVATKEKIVEGAWPGDKLLLTGDYGYFDTDGFFYLDGRMDDVVKIRGYKVQLKRIEDVLREHPLVLDVCVFCHMDNLCIDQIIAAVVLENDNFNWIEEEFLQFCNQKLLSHELPKKVYCVKNLRKNTNGKIDRSSVLKDFIRNQNEYGE